MAKRSTPKAKTTRSALSKSGSNKQLNPLTDKPSTTLRHKTHFEEKRARSRQRLLQLSPLLIILLLAFGLRLYRVTNPPLDWHAHRQADTAAVTRDFVRRGVTFQTLLTPTYADISSIQSSLPNPNGYRMVEFPLPNALIALLVSAVPALNLDITSRVVAALVSLLTILSLFSLGRAFSGKQVGLIAALLFAVLPFSVYYSRAILPEPFLVAALTVAIATFLRWLEGDRWRWYFISLLSLSIALLLKPFALFFAPVFLALIYLYRERCQIKQYILIGMYGAALIPFILWRVWIQQFPEGIPASTWLLNGNGIRLRPAWFRWLFFERMGKLILGFVGLIFLPLSLYRQTNREILFYGSWWFGAFAYLIVIATGNVQHDYYQYLIMPILCLSVARGVVVLQRLLSKRLHPLISWLIVSALILSTVLLSYHWIKGYWNVNHWEFVRAGEAVQRLTDENSKVIAPHMSDTQLLYQTNRQGWPLGGDIDTKIKEGATHYLTSNFDEEATQLQAKYLTLEQTSEYLLLDLTKEKAVTQ